MVKREHNPDGTSVEYVRCAGQWVKVTRDPAARRFDFARGYEGNVVAHDRRRWSFTYMPTWSDALGHAQRWIADHS